MASQTPSIRRSAQDDRRLEEGRTGLPAPSPDSVKPNGDDQQQEQPAPLLFVATRVCVGLAFYLTWLPYVLLIILRERRTYEALIFGVALHCFALVFNLALKLTQQKRVRRRGRAPPRKRDASAPLLLTRVDQARNNRSVLLLGSKRARARSSGVLHGRSWHGSCDAPHGVGLRRCEDAAQLAWHSAALHRALC